MRTIRACTSSVERPCFLHDLAVIKSIAIEPEPQARLVLYPEIVARQHFTLRSPPLHGDTLGAFGADDRVGGATPDKSRGRPIRHLGDDLDLFRALEQP